MTQSISYSIRLCVFVATAGLVLALLTPIALAAQGGDSSPGPAEAAAGDGGPAQRRLDFRCLRFDPF